MKLLFDSTDEIKILKDKANACDSLRKKGLPKFATDCEKLYHDIDASTSLPFEVDQDSTVPEQVQIE